MTPFLITAISEEGIIKSRKVLMTRANNVHVWNHWQSKMAEVRDSTGTAHHPRISRLAMWYSRSRGTVDVLLPKLTLTTSYEPFVAPTVFAPYSVHPRAANARDHSMQLLVVGNHSGIRAVVVRTVWAVKTRRRAGAASADPKRVACSLSPCAVEYQQTALMRVSTLSTLELSDGKFKLGVDALSTSATITVEEVICQFSYKEVSVKANGSMRFITTIGTGTSPSLQ